MPGARFEREKALLNELRNHDFFFREGDGEGDVDGSGCGGEADDTELRLVTCEAILETESFDS